MTRIIAILLATSAAAEPVTLAFDAREGDSAQIHMESAYSGVLTYHNIAAMHSTTGTWTVEADHVSCRLSITVGDDEHAIVECADGWVAHPRSAYVPDGESFDFQIIYQAF